MNAQRSVPRPRRRLACPDLTNPMPTGDGLLARLVPDGHTIALEHMAALCAAAQTYGNGVIEVTSRGSVQIRGLTTSSTGRFVAAVDPLRIATPGPPILLNPLNGIDRATTDGAVIADALRRSVFAAALEKQLAPKASIIIDASSDADPLHLDHVPADLRLRATPDGRIHIAVGGDAREAVSLGTVAAEDAVAATTCALHVIARFGRAVRARDVVRLRGIDAFRADIAPILREGLAPRVRARAEPIGPHPLRDQSIALGFGLAFGHTDARALVELTSAAMRAGVLGVRTAARALLLIDVAPTTAPELTATAERLGFIVRAGDPRRHVAACAGAPICAAAKIPARALAPVIADSCAGMLDGSFVLHLSGCPKGCAHPAPSVMTIVGDGDRCGLTLNAPASAAARDTIATTALGARLAVLAREIAHARADHETAAETLARLGPDRVRTILMEVAHV